MKRIVLIFVLLLFVVIANCYFYQRISAPITSDHRTFIYTQTWNGQLMVNPFLVQGDSVKWEFKPIDSFKTIEELMIFKNSLHPTSSYFSKVEPFKEKTYILKIIPRYNIRYYYTYPVIFSKSSEKVINK